MSIATTDTTVAADAFQQLTDFGACLFEPADKIEVRRIAAGGQIEREYLTASELPERWQRLAAANKAGRNLYVGVNPRKRSGGKAEDVAQANSIFVDDDQGDTPEPDKLLERIAAKGLPRPTLVVASGHGVHAYWRLAEPLTDMAEFTRRQKQLSALLGTDPKVCDPPRIMRMPGFLNVKQADRPVPCSIVEHDASRRYPLSELCEVLDKVQTAATNGHATRASSYGDVLDRARKYIAKMPPAVSGQGGHDQTYAVACVLAIGFGLGRDDALALLREYNHRCDPPWTERELEHKVDQALQAEGERGHLLRKVNGHSATLRLRIEEAGTADDELPSLRTSHGLTQLANAARLVHLHGNSIRYCGSWKKWLDYNGKQWVADANHRVELRAKDVPEVLWEQIASLVKSQEVDGKEAAALVRFATASSSARGLQDMLSLARSSLSIAVVPDDLDVDHMLFNVDNGTIDLRNGELRPHDRDDLLTKISPVAFDPAAVCPTWERFLLQVLHDQPDLVAYLQRCIGYCLTGEVSEQCIWILHGKGSNGKSTFLSAVMEMMGPDYATPAAPDLLLVKSGSNHPTELADLFGRRMVVATEVEEGRRFAESLVKMLTGGERVKARRCKEDFWSFVPRHKLWLGTNHMPAIRGSDHGIWRRIRLLPFTVQIPDDQQDKKLPDKLRAELPGILAWAVRGCLEWQRIGLGLPPEVVKAVQSYKADQDTLAQFITECCSVGECLKVRASELFEVFSDWCGGQIIPQRKFGSAMSERGFARYTNNGTWYRGIGLRRIDGE